VSEWDPLRKWTQARIGMSRAGSAISTSEQLKFQLDHARARDAVHWAWDPVKFQKALKSKKIPSLILKSAARTRDEYLARPDLGRALDPESLKKLKKTGKAKTDVAVVVSNGLSSSALSNHGAQFLNRLLKELRGLGLKVSPVYLVENGRVALSDVLGSAVSAKLVIMILGERPGLSSFDSLAMYLTYGPRMGNSDAQRNCVSNIRPPEGLSYEQGVQKTLYLVSEALRRKLSGVDLKEESGLLV
jgi:ethanolamine ammonia-lyase small subunit